MSESLSGTARRSMRKELVRLRMEMHRQQLRHHAQPLTRPLNYLGQLRRDSPGSLEPPLLLTAEVLLTLFGSRLGRFGKLARIALLFYPLARGAQKPGGVPSRH
ncbi:hypothetical protein [Pseudomonas sp. BMS12]|uniref:hypothetical protein n=1 Tax=Pseudomonas sp. BMS12 TaxID=1796033 RepID=UPI00083AB95A|nr:hypothetical protein [Pseudomonas sp. BMS12]